MANAYGQIADDIVASVGVDAAVLYREDLWLSEVQYNDVMEALALACNDQFILFKLADHQGWSVLGAVEPMLDQCQTIGEALQMLVEYANEYLETLLLQLTEEDDGLAICFEVRAFDTWNPANLSGQLHNIDLPMAIFCKELRHQFGDQVDKQWNPRYVQLSYAEPKSKSALERVYGKNCYFNQDINAISLADEDLAKPFQPGTRAHLASTSLVKREEAHQIPFLLRVERSTRLLLSSGECTAKDVANTLKMNLRTMQHQLTAHQTSYRKIYSAVRLDLAQYYLAESNLSIGAISERLGFCDSAAFSHFFKRNARMSPSAYVAQVKAVNR